MYSKFENPISKALMVEVFYDFKLFKAKITTTLNGHISTCVKVCLSLVVCTIFQNTDVVQAALDFKIALCTGHPRFTRFQFTRIHTTRFFQGLRGRGLMGSTEPLILKICSKTCQYCKIQEKFVTFALNQCFSNS